MTTKEMKKTVNKEETFDLLEIRTGKVISVEDFPSALKKSYKLKIDFGKFGIKQSIGRFTNHSKDEIKDKIVLGVLNFEPRQIGSEISEVLVLGVQFPKADSGEATFITPAIDTKIGKKLF
ncbi:MAG: putative chaperone CsaA [Candidatus Anoxychlamydiales bacterium]|nr:putative chaperone CsaA [Candidatus Anoxychlamydiales bacterium]